MSRKRVRVLALLVVATVTMTVWRVGSATGRASAEGGTHGPIAPARASVSASAADAVSQRSTMLLSCSALAALALVARRRRSVR